MVQGRKKVKGEGGKKGGGRKTCVGRNKSACSGVTAIRRHPVINLAPGLPQRVGNMLWGGENKAVQLAHRNRNKSPYWFFDHHRKGYVVEEPWSGGGGQGGSHQNTCMGMGVPGSRKVCGEGGVYVESCRKKKGRRQCMVTRCATGTAGNGVG